MNPHGFWSVLVTILIFTTSIPNYSIAILFLKLINMKLWFHMLPPRIQIPDFSIVGSWHFGVDAKTCCAKYLSTECAYRLGTVLWKSEILVSAGMQRETNEHSLTQGTHQASAPWICSRGRQATKMPSVTIEMEGKTASCGLEEIRVWEIKKSKLSCVW